MLEIYSSIIHIPAWKAWRQNDLASGAAVARCHQRKLSCGSIWKIRKSKDLATESIEKCYSFEIYRNSMHVIEVIYLY